MYKVLNQMTAIGLTWKKQSLRNTKIGRVNQVLIDL